MSSRSSSSFKPAKKARSGVGNFKTVIRVRPPNQDELEEGNLIIPLPMSEIGATDGNKTCFAAATRETCVLEVKGKTDPYVFPFDRIFDCDSTQTEIFEEVGIPAVDNVLQGFDSNIFAYGQTGAGKTHTMLGVIKSVELRGLTPRVFEYLFQKIKEEQQILSPPPEYRVACSNLQVYNEKITDLLTPGSTNLQLRSNTKHGSRATYVEGLKEVEIKNTEDALDVVEQGINSLMDSATDANLISSRSHCVFTCVITRQRKRVNGSEISRISRLNLVDLAGMPSLDAATRQLNVGSERVKPSQSNDTPVRELLNLSKSLTCWCRVIKELADVQRIGGKRYVPYRDTKLTAILEESLKGDSRTMIIAAVCPMFNASLESLSTLQTLNRITRAKDKNKIDKNLRIETLSIHGTVLKLRSRLEMTKSKDSSTASREEAVEQIEPNSEAKEKPQHKEKEHQKLESELVEMKKELENTMAANSRLKNEISTLRKLKSDLQRTIDEMMKYIAKGQQKIIEVEKITEKAHDAKRQAINDETTIHKRPISAQEPKKHQRDVKIDVPNSKKRSKLDGHAGRVEESKTRHKATVETCTDRLEKEKHSWQYEELRTMIREKEVSRMFCGIRMVVLQSELRTTARRWNEENAAMRRRLDEKLVRHKAKLIEREKSLHGSRTLK